MKAKRKFRTSRKRQISNGSDDIEAEELKAENIIKKVYKEN